MSANFTVMAAIEITTLGPSAETRGAAHLYHRLGYTLTGEIPDYAFKPHGGLTGTLVFWKRIGPARLPELT